MPEGFLRPEMEVLREETVIPARNLVQPAPNVFTHETVDDTPFYFGREADGGEANGYFKAGAGVVLLVRGEHGRCRVIDGQGVYAEVSADSLAERPRG